jgi:hypothetical protein
MAGSGIRIIAYDVILDAGPLDASKDCGSNVAGPRFLGREMRR